MLITPHVSEKSYKLAADNVYVFRVPLNANKSEITAVIEAENKDVKVRDVRLSVIKGKPKAVNRGKRSRPSKTTRKDWKKAYVTLAEGKIEVAAFAEIENEINASNAKQSSEAQSSTKSEGSGAVASDDKKSKSTIITRRRTGRRGDR